MNNDEVKKRIDGWSEIQIGDNPHNALPLYLGFADLAGLLGLSLRVARSHAKVYAAGSNGRVTIESGRLVIHRIPPKPKIPERAIEEIRSFLQRDYQGLDREEILAKIAEILQDHEVEDEVIVKAQG